MTRLAGTMRMLAVAAVLIVAGGIIAMHQLSIGHAVVVPVVDEQVSAPASPDQPAESMIADDHSAMGGEPGSALSGSDDHGGHPDDDLGSMTCLAVVGLLLLAWLVWLQPRLRCYPVVLGVRHAFRVLRPTRPRKNALSLQELSICRT